MKFNPFTGKLDHALPNGMYWNAAQKYLSLGRTGATARLHIRGLTVNDVGRFDVGTDYILVTPPVSPTLQLLNVPGNLNVGTHFYRITYKTAIGETEFNASTIISVVTDGANGQVQVNLPTSTDYRVTHVKIYRAVTGGTYWLDVKLVGTVVNGTATFVDNISDANRTGLDNSARGNTTNRFLSVNGATALHVSAQNTFLGYRAGEGTVNGTSTGGENTIFGASSGLAINGNKNCAFGIFIGVGTSDSSCFFGHNAGGVGGYFQGCIIVGRNAAFNNTASYASVIIGGSAAAGQPGYYSANNNTVIGVGAHYKASQGCGNNVIIGTSAASDATSIFGNIIIGALVNPASLTAPGQLNIGNVIYGTGMYSADVMSNTPTTGGTLDFYALTTFRRGQKVNRTPVGVGNYVVPATDYIIEKTAITGGGDTVTLPNAATNAGQVFVIKDAAGSAAVDNITVATAGGNIDGLATRVINVAGGLMKVYSSGVNYFII